VAISCSFRLMAHAAHFDPSDPVLAQLRQICVELPSAEEKVSHGRPCFFTKKIFAIYGGATKGEDGQRFDESLVFQPNEGEVAALRHHPLVYVPMYWGPHGWLGFDLSESPDWEEVAELVEDSFRLTANKTQIKALDARAD